VTSFHPMVTIRSPFCGHWAAVSVLVGLCCPALLNCIDVGLDVHIIGQINDDDDDKTI